MFASSRICGLIGPALTVVALLVALPGCEEDTKPKITRMWATPQCDEMKTVTQVILDPADSSIVDIDTLGVWMEVIFGARASSGNAKADPTGANSPLDWTWNFGDGTTATNVVGPTHRYKVAGEYTVHLSVKDDDGDEDTETMIILVGEAYTDLDILDVEFEPVPELLFTLIPESVATDLSQAWGDQFALSGMDMIFDGTLLTSCTISGLYEQYLWEWTIVEPPSTEEMLIVDLDPAVLSYTASYLELETSLHIVESETGIDRRYPEPEPMGPPAPRLSSYNPVGVKVGRTVPRTTIPGTTDTLLLEGYLLGDVTEMSFQLEWDEAAAVLDGVVFDPAITSGFTSATSEIIAPGLVEISLTSASGYAGSEVITKIADLNFTPNEVMPTTYPVRIRVPYATRPWDGEDGASFTTLDGAIEIDTDCDGDGIPDSFQAEFFPELYDCNGNGIHDTCDVVHDISRDCQPNGVPDECDIRNGTSEDQNQNGIPDECES